MLLIPLTVCTAMFESDMGGLFFGLAAGLSWDVCCTVGDGFYPLLFVAAGYLTSYCTSRYLRNHFVTATVLSLLFSASCAGLYKLIFVVPADPHGGFSLFLGRYIISILYTTALTPVYYCIVKLIVNSTKTAVRDN